MYATAGSSYAQFVLQGGIATTLALNATHILMGHGTNDLSGGTSSTLDIINYAITAAQPIILANNSPTILYRTLTPDLNSTDGFTLLANQNWPRAAVSLKKEPFRRQYNNVLILANNIGATVVNEAMFILLTGTGIVYNTNFYAGGNGVATTFYTAGYPFVVGTEVIKVNGVTKVVTTDYTYANQVTVNSVSYACGVIFNVAPTNAFTVTASYTGIAGIGKLIGTSKLAIIDVASAVEVDAAGTPGVNGGLWAAANNPSIITGTTSGSNSTTVFNDTSLTLTQDQYRGESIMIVTDSGNASAVGEVSPIIANTIGGVFTVSFSQTPSATATYKIYRPYVSTEPATAFGGIHPATYGSMVMGAVLDTYIIAHNGYITI